MLSYRLINNKFIICYNNEILYKEILLKLINEDQYDYLLDNSKIHVKLLFNLSSNSPCYGANTYNELLLSIKSLNGMIAYNKMLS